MNIEMVTQSATKMNPASNLAMGTELRHSEALSAPISFPVLAKIPAKTQSSLLRMFADPHLLENEERAELVRALRDCVLAHPEVSDLRVLYGMALCVDFKAQEAIEELREGVRLAPESFIAHLKMGELWMRLRVCEKAEEHTHQAALLARNHVAVRIGAPPGCDDSDPHAQRNQARWLQLQKPVAVGRSSLRKLWKRDRAAADGLAIVETQS